MGEQAWDLGVAEAGGPQLCGCSLRSTPLPSSLVIHARCPTSVSLLRFLQEGRGPSVAEGTPGPKSSHITRLDGQRDQRVGGFLANGRSFTRLMFCCGSWAKQMARDKQGVGGGFEWPQPPSGSWRQWRVR